MKNLHRGLALFLIISIAVAVFSFGAIFERHGLLRITGHLSAIGGWCSATDDCLNGVCINSKCCKVDDEGNAVIPYVCYPEEPAVKKANGQSCSTYSDCESDNCQCAGASCYGQICCPSGNVCCLTASDCGSGYLCQNYNCFKKDGSPCEGGGKCASGNCVHSVCCAAGKHCCDSGDDCDDAGADYQCSLSYYCVPKSEPSVPSEPFPEPSTKRQNGYTCMSNDECQSGWCSNTRCCETGGRCCATDTSCGTGYFCDETNNRHVCMLSSGAEAIPITETAIVPAAETPIVQAAETPAAEYTGAKHLCGSCSVDGDCESGKCGAWKHPVAGEMKVCIGVDDDATLVMCCSSGVYIWNFRQNQDCCTGGPYADLCLPGYQCINNQCQLPAQASSANINDCLFPSCYADFGNGWKCYSHKQSEKGSYCCAGDIQDVPCDQRKKTPEEKVREKLEEYKKKKPKEVMSARFSFVPEQKELVMRRGESFVFQLDCINNGTVTLDQCFVGARISGSAIEAGFSGLGPYYGTNVERTLGIFGYNAEPDFIIKAVNAGDAVLTVHAEYNYKGQKKRIEQEVKIKVLDENVNNNPEASTLFDRKNMPNVKEINEKVEIQTPAETYTFDSAVIVREEEPNAWARSRIGWIKQANRIRGGVTGKGMLKDALTPDVIGAFGDIKDIVEADMAGTPDEYTAVIIGKTLRSCTSPIGFDIGANIAALTFKADAAEQLQSVYPKGLRFGTITKDGKSMDVMYYAKDKKAYMVVLDEY